VDVDDSSLTPDSHAVGLVWFEGWQPPGAQSAFNSADELGELSQWPHRDNSTINTVIGIIVIIVLKGRLSTYGPAQQNLLLTDLGL